MFLIMITREELEDYLRHYIVGGEEWFRGNHFRWNLLGNDMYYIRIDTVELGASFLYARSFKILLYPDDTQNSMFRDIFEAEEEVMRYLKVNNVSVNPKFNNIQETN